MTESSAVAGTPSPRPSPSKEGEGEHPQGASDSIEGAHQSEAVTREGLVEACVFVSETPVSDKKIAAALGCPVKDVRDALKMLRARYDSAGGALELIEIAEGWRFATRPHYEPHLNKLFGVRRIQRLSRAALEVLSIVAYNQPVTGQEVQQIRGIDSYAVLKGLSEQGYIRIAGRKDAPGSPLLYATTPAFLEYFGLKDLTELPSENELDQMFQGPIEQVVVPNEDDFAPDSAPAAVMAGAPSPSASAKVTADTQSAPSVAGAEESGAVSA